MPRDRSPKASGGDPLRSRRSEEILDSRAHWNRVYSTKGERDVSWYEAVPAASLRMIEAAGLTSATCIVDVGGGDSRLVDALLARGVTCITVVDVSSIALQRTQARLGDAAAAVRWVTANVTAEWTIEPVDIWHDRAVFHFLIDAEERARYRQRLAASLAPGGSAIIATFALDGPETCSGLPVSRYSPGTLAAELGDEFVLIDTCPHVHTTPWGSTQSFQYSRFVRTARPEARSSNR